MTYKSVEEVLHSFLNTVNYCAMDGYKVYFYGEEIENANAGNNKMRMRDYNLIEFCIDPGFSIDEYEEYLWSKTKIYNELKDESKHEDCTEIFKNKTNKNVG